MDGDAFRAYVEHVLVADLTPGDVGVMMYLPAYSPDFNPIEMAFSKFKALLRAAAARTILDLWAAIRIALDAFTPNECQNYFAAAGYDAF
jgi:transposase